jgi:hypothetical protein
MTPSKRSASEWGFVLGDNGVTSVLVGGTFYVNWGTPCIRSVLASLLLLPPQPERIVVDPEHDRWPLYGDGTGVRAGRSAVREQRCSIDPRRLEPIPDN